jgi:putative hydrolase of the HAD superfamily
MLTLSDTIHSIVFDLDGTLYVCPEIAAEIEEATATLVAATRGVPPAKGRELLTKARQRLSENGEEEPTLTRTCLALGIDLPDLHAAFQKGVHPERYLDPDPVLMALLDSLSEYCDLYIYTNNNLYLSRKILALLGIQTFFRRIYSIEFAAAPKPDPDALWAVLEDIGDPAEQVLFVGDRAAVDLHLPASMGSPTLLVRETADLLQIHKLLGLIP